MNSNEKTAVKATFFSICINIIIASIKWVAGYFGNSYALIADAIESTTDIFASILVLFGIKYASRPPDKNHPYGHGRIEPLITFIVVCFLFYSAYMIASGSIKNIGKPHEIPKTFTLYVLGMIILFKEASFRYVLRKSKQTNSSSLKADAWHHRADAITSIAAFIGISIAIFMGKGYESADDWAALVAAGLIIYNACKILLPALGEILDEHQYDDLVNSIRENSKKVAGVIDTEKCLIRKTGMTFQVDLHVIVDAKISVKEGHAIAAALKYSLIKDIPLIAYVLIHVEPFDDQNENRDFDVI